MSYAVVVGWDPTWASKGSPEYWGIHGRQFFFYPRVSASWAADSANSLPYAYSKMMKHVADDGATVSGTFPTGRYADADYPDLPHDEHEGLVDGALYRELEVALGPGAGDKTQAKWLNFLTRMAGKTAVIGGGGSPTIRLSRRDLVGSSMR